MPLQPATPGKLLISVSALGQAIGSYMSDFNHTHILNPNWPPHARFHNGQTMSMGLGLGLATLYYTWIVPRNHDNLLSALLMNTIYWLAGVSAILYPGTDWVDPEFRDQRLGTHPQLIGFPVFVLFAVAGWWMEGGTVFRSTGGDAADGHHHGHANGDGRVHGSAEHGLKRQ